jgi:DNA-binding MurR/RpiR family transcriptional regulator
MKRIKSREVISGDSDSNNGTPYICDCRNVDIPNTIRWMIRNAPEGMVAISLRPYDAEMIKLAEREARRRNARVIWVPIGNAIKKQAAAALASSP